MADLNIRQMGEADLEGVLEIEQQVYPFPWSRQIFIDSIEAGSLLVVMEQRNKIVGYGVLSSGGGESQLLNIAIDPESQKKGMGEILLSWLIERARSKGSEMLFLEVRLSNISAQNLYLKLGFNEIGVRDNYYRVAGGKREDALIYALQFLPK
ncbi:MAG: ribosomal protein S18-alanine N-acetyltransferase [Gammaproteobacteria bacterium]|uniref:[Ribosomal protein bS18]-alanine N-acetyltransferase n=1 Tax=Candidatus Thiopontia autotrophica TaxID=2841688 RepID=A0A8J6TSG2_9GAMM|nr:ribosomal protein S18-alanine N-acetyltransferase [Candidatus Thiopontia autotrophica]MBL6969407.1 ribosomal protein S18-alanine N-acetyltransferase [Gammaproteobacteria bacterium]